MSKIMSNIMWKSETKSSIRVGEITREYIQKLIHTYVAELMTEEIFHNFPLKLFRTAVRHESAIQNNCESSYERLEYLGDAVFNYTVTEYCYQRYSDENDDFFTQLRIKLVRSKSMVELANNIDLVQFIVVGEININYHIVEDVFEAFIGAFYLNFGMKYTKIFVVSLLETHKNFTELIAVHDNFKDILLRYFHQRLWNFPKYSSEKNAQGKFKSTVCDPDGKVIGVGIARTKKKAEQFASKSALKTLKVIINDRVDPDWLSKVDRPVIKEKKQHTAKTTPYNPSNKLWTKTELINFFKKYGITLKRDKKITLKTFHEAMTHKSYLRRKTLPSSSPYDKKIVPLQTKYSDKIQFIGGALVNFILGEYLYHRSDQQDEGTMTKLRCKLINKNTLFFLAKASGIDQYVLISQTIEDIHGRDNVNIMGGAFDAFIGAVYLNFGIDITRQLVIQIVEKEINFEQLTKNETNYKDVVLQIYHYYNYGTPDYRLLEESDQTYPKMFTMGLFLGDKCIGKGTSTTKKEAEQLASKDMLESLQNMD